ncbi:MAG: S41 family peptidase [Sphingomonadaceae bacterium]
MRYFRSSLAFVLAVSLASCGGGGGSSGGSGGAGSGGSGGGTPTPTPTTGTCSLSARQDWVKSAVDEWYLFPSLVDNGVIKANYTNLQDYLDALVAPARAQSRDRYFSYVTSIAEENAYYSSGATAGFGFRLGYDTANGRVFVIESFEGTSAMGANIDRGSEILSIGISSTSAQTISSLMASGGAGAVYDALGPSTAGTTRFMRVRDQSGVERDVTLTKTDYSLDPVSSRYGSRIIDDGGKKVGYINLRTFISTAEPELRTAFASFRAQGVNEVIVDLRYNGGGLLTVSQTFGSLLGQNRVGQVFGQITYRASKSAENETFPFVSENSGIGAMKIAFIGRGGTASASELLANAFIPYLGNNIALIGTNTYGKPVGQNAFDRSQCDDRLRLVTFRTENRDGNGDYYTGLASVMPNTCMANDDITRPLGDPAEASVAAALDFLGGRGCTPIAVGTRQRTMQVTPQRQLLMPDLPEATTAQREVPGLF